ncbi:hypothetical protein OROMI_001424 [Orobanche minor]
MGRAASYAYMVGVRVLGVIPKPLAESKIIGATIGDEFRVANMQDRISHMSNNADAFITLLGGFGTLEELFHVVIRAQLNIHTKPIGLLNVNGFFDGLLTFINYSFEKGFISERYKRIIVVATTPEELIKKLIAFVPEPDPALANIIWTENFSVRKCRIALNKELYETSSADFSDSISELYIKSYHRKKIWGKNAKSKFWAEK